MEDPTSNHRIPTGNLDIDGSSFYNSRSHIPCRPSPKHRWWFVAERGMGSDGVVVMAAADCGAIYAAWIPAFENVA
jgi:hypothetical protein